MIKKILITGISGSGGSYLAEHILNKKGNLKIYGILRNKKKLSSYNLKNLKKNPRVKFSFIGLSNLAQLKKYFKKVKPDIIYHLASNADVLSSFSKPYQITKNNILITLNLLEAFRLAKINCRLVLCSTSEVYGNVDKKFQPITEKNKIDPINPYAVSKTFQDLLAQNYCKIYNLDIVITRMFTYLNAKRDNLFASAFANQLVLNKEKKQFNLKHGYLGSIRTILDIRDAMDAYWLAGIKGKTGRIYNISGKKKLSIKEFLSKLILYSKTNPRLIENKKLIRPKDINLQISKSIKIKKDTSWKEKVSLDKSISYFYDEIKKKIKFRDRK